MLAYICHGHIKYILYIFQFTLKTESHFADSRHVSLYWYHIWTVMLNIQYTGSIPNAVDEITGSSKIEIYTTFPIGCYYKSSNLFITENFYITYEQITLHDFFCSSTLGILQPKMGSPEVRITAQGVDSCYFQPLIKVKKISP